MKIIYRGFNLESILINKDGHISVTNFEFAKRIEDRTQTMCGDICYRSPETLRGEGSTLKSDLWGLGIMLFELIGGYTPFQNVEDPIDIVA